MRRYKFSKRGHQSSGHWHRFHNLDEASRFVQSAINDFDTLNELRRWAFEDSSYPQRNDDLVKIAAAHLVSGELRIAKHHRRSHTNYMKSQSEKLTIEEPSPRKPASPVERATPSSMFASRTAPTQSTPTKQAPIDIAQQVEALLAAARSGAPFCEQCQKAKSG